jgi:hypothetical protein
MSRQLIWIYTGHTRKNAYMYIWRKGLNCVLLRKKFVRRLENILKLQFWSCLQGYHHNRQSNREDNQVGAIIYQSKRLWCNGSTGKHAGLQKFGFVKNPRPKIIKLRLQTGHLIGWVSIPAIQMLEIWDWSSVLVLWSWAQCYNIRYRLMWLFKEARDVKHLCLALNYNMHEVNVINLGTNIHHSMINASYLCLKNMFFFVTAWLDFNETGHQALKKI